MTHSQAQHPQITRLLLVTCVVALAVACMAVRPQSASADDRIKRPDVPDALKVPAGHKVFLVGQAVGTQNYICLPADSSVAWTLFGPQATLFTSTDRQLITHFLSPNPDEQGMLRATWQHSRDTSAVWALAIASSSDPNFVDEGAIPWLLLQVVGRERGPTGGAELRKTLFIQRLNTTGGSAPETGCTQSTNIGRREFVPYTADYFFYKKAAQDHERDDEE